MIRKVHINYNGNSYLAVNNQVVLIHYGSKHYNITSLKIQQKPARDYVDGARTYSIDNARIRTQRTHVIPHMTSQPLVSCTMHACY